MVELTFISLRDDSAWQVTVTGPDETPVPVGEPVLVGGGPVVRARRIRR